MQSQIVVTVWFSNKLYRILHDFAEHHPSRHKTLNQSYFNVGPTSTTLDQRQTSIYSTHCVCWVSGYSWRKLNAYFSGLYVDWVNVESKRVFLIVYFMFLLLWCFLPSIYYFWWWFSTLKSVVGFNDFTIFLALITTTTTRNWHEKASHLVPWPFWCGTQPHPSDYVFLLWSATEVRFNVCIGNITHTNVFWHFKFLTMHQSIIYISKECQNNFVHLGGFERKLSSWNTFNMFNNNKNFHLPFTSSQQFAACSG